MGELLKALERARLQAKEAARAAEEAFLRFIEAFADLLHYAGLGKLAWWVYVLLFLAAAIGVPSALILKNELTGGGESAAPAAVVAPTAATTPTTAPLATAPLATPPPPAATQPAVPGIITVRGAFDPSVYAPLTVVENSIILELPRDGGSVKGTAMVSLDNFPIGAALEGIMGGPSPDYPALHGCTSVVTLKADDIQGSYSPSPQGATITGSATFVGGVEDRPCLSGLPPSMAPSRAVQPATLTLNATFDGHQVQGTFTAPSGKQQKFEATVQ